MITNNEFFSKFDGANKTRYYDVRIEPEELMKTPQSLGDIIAILTRTEPADDSRLDVALPRNAVTATLIGEAPLPLRHLWNEYVTLNESVKNKRATPHERDMRDLIGELLMVGMRDVYGSDIREEDVCFILTGWRVYILVAHAKAAKQHAVVH